MSKLRVGCSPLTKTIFAGRLNKAGNAWIGDPVDVTSDVLGSVIEKVGAGNVITVRENGKPAYEISVRAIKADGIAPTTQDSGVGDE